jgi:hypothetical protein
MLNGGFKDMTDEEVERLKNRLNEVMRDEFRLNDKIITMFWQHLVTGIQLNTLEQDYEEQMKAIGITL